MFIRWVTEQVDKDSGRRRGVVQAAYDLLDAGMLLDFEREELRADLKWLANNLLLPGRFSRSDKPGAAPLAISWLRASSLEHVRVMRRLMAVLKEHGVYVSELQGDRPGYLVYEDEHQVVAEPFQDTST